MKILRDEEVKNNQYFYKQNIFNARTLFRYRVELFEAKLNFENKEEYKREKYICDSCESSIDENTHVIFCPSYKELRVGRRLEDDTDLAMYLQEVLTIRAKLRLTR